MLGNCSYILADAPCFYGSDGKLKPFRFNDLTTRALIDRTELPLLHVELFFFQYLPFMKAAFA